jgi:VCBS repeat-containing protein
VLLSKVYPIIILTLLSSIGIFPTNSYAGQISELDDISIYTSSDGTIYIDSDITVSGAPNNFSNGYLDILVSTPSVGSNSGDLLSVINDPAPNVVGAVSIDQGNLFYGFGDRKVRVGAFDELKDGKGGNPLRVHFAIPFVNGSFEQSIDVGWNTFDQRYGDDGDEINYNNYPIPLANDQTYSGGTGVSYPQAPSRSMSLNSVIVSGTASVGSQSLKITSSGSILDEGVPANHRARLTDGNGSYHGPYVRSEVIHIEEGEGLTLDFKAVGRNDHYEVFGTLRRVDGNGTPVSNNTPSTEPNSDNILLFAQRGHDTAGFSTSAEVGLIEGDYIFEFVGGTYDYTGGLGVGSELFIDNLKLTSAALVDQSLVEKLIEHIQYSNSGVNPPQGKRSITFSAVSVSSESSSGSVDIYTNTVPILSGSVATINEGDALNFQPSMVDQDNSDSHSYTVSNLPSWASFDTKTGTLSGTPSNGDVGIYQDIGITVTDSHSASDSIKFSLTVININDAPVIIGTPSNGVNQDALYHFTPKATDVDIDVNPSEKLVYSIENKPAWASFDVKTGKLSGTPANADVGQYTNIIISVSDVANTKVPLTAFTINVININDYPVITMASTLSTNEDTSGILSFSYTDIDGDTVVASTKTTPSHGSLAISGTELTYTPSEHYFGSDTFTVTLTDGHGFSTDKIVKVTVNSINDEPLIEMTSTLTLDEDTQKTLNFSFEDADGDTVVASVKTAPTNGNLSISGTGLTYVPNEHYFGSDSFIVTLTDGNGFSIDKTVSISVNSINDLPTVSKPIDSFTITSKGDWSFSIQNDVFKDVEDDSFTHTLATPIKGISIVGSSVNFSEMSHLIGNSQVTVIATDSDSGQAQAAFTLVVQLDTDGDKIADIVDEDDDNDGIPDTWEVANNFDPLDGLDAAKDTDNDGRSNYDEYVGNHNPRSDDVPPSLTIPADIDLYAQSLFTYLGRDFLAGNVLASSDVGDNNCCNVSIENLTDGYYRSGEFKLVWLAKDKQGNETRRTQTVRIHPMISLNKDRDVFEGEKSSISVNLNGPSPVYPVTVKLTVEEDASDHNLVSQEVVLEQGEVSKKITFDILADQDVEGVEVYSVTLEKGLYNSMNAATNTRIYEEGFLPKVTLVTSQDSKSVSRISRIFDKVSFSFPTLSKQHFTIEWQVGSTVYQGPLFELSTLELNGRLVDVIARISSVDSPNLQVDKSFSIGISDQLADLSSTQDTDQDGISDLVEGYSDDDGDGIANYIDTFSESNLLPEYANNTDGFIIESDAGVRLKLSGISLLSDYNGAFVNDSRSSDGAVAKDIVENVGGLFAFEADEIEIGQTVNFVIPQYLSIPDSAVYRKYVSGEWVSFTVDDANYVTSAPGEKGYCPVPGSDKYKTGLNQGDWCVQITIKDGGANDSDGVANGIIKDPGGVGVEENEAVVTNNKTTGGSVTLWSIIVFAMVLVQRYYSHFLSRVLVGLLGFISFHSVAGSVYMTGQAGVAYSDISDAELQNTISQVSDTAVLQDADSNDAYFSLILGYQLNPYFALEAGYADLGKRTFSVSNNTVPELEIEQYMKTIAKVQLQSARGGTLGLSLSYPIKDIVNFYVKGGAFFWSGDFVSDSKASVQGNYSYQYEERGIDPYYGVGFIFPVTDNISIGVEWGRYEVTDFKTDVAALSIKYFF